jgi:hypothetical protein
MSAPTNAGSTSSGPFRRQEALAAGVTPGKLRGPLFERVHHGVHVPAGFGDDLIMRCWAATLALPSDAAFSHQTAAALYLRDERATGQLHVSVPAGSVVPRHRTIVGHERDFRTGDVTKIFGLPILSAACTFVDLAGVQDDAHLMAFGDAVLRAGFTDLDELRARVESAARRRGVKRARWVLPNLDPRAESPMESVVRSYLLRGGLPRPEVNAEIFDETGLFVARADLLFRAQRVIAEYDGEQHRTSHGQFSHDLRRTARLQQLGFIVLRFTAAHVYREPEWVVQTVAEALRIRGADIPRHPRLR